MTYYLLASFNLDGTDAEGEWHAQFGDHDKGAVQEEMRDAKRADRDWCGVRNAYQIVAFPRVPTSRQIAEKLATLANPKAA